MNQEQTTAPKQAPRPAEVSPSTAGAGPRSRPTDLERARIGRRSALFLASVVFAGSALLSGCGADPDAAPLVVLHASTPAASGNAQMAFELDRNTVPAGPVRIEFTNRGDVVHQLMVVKVRPGTSSVVAAQTAGVGAKIALLLGGKAPLVESFGGPNNVARGDTVSTTRILQPGNYVLLCLLPSGKVNHAALGMHQSFTVTPAAGGRAAQPFDPLPPIQQFDFAFVMPGRLIAGEDVTVVNNGTQPHELALFRIASSTTVAAVKAQLAGLTKDPPLTTGVPGGLTLMSPHERQVITLPKSPGTYIAACFMPDIAGKGIPHFMLGMITKFTIRPNEVDS